MVTGPSPPWTVDAVELGRARVPAEEILFKDRSHTVLDIPLVMFVLRSGPRTIVVDTGGHPDGEHIRTHHGIDYEPTVPGGPRTALEALDVDPDEVDTVVNTHLHWDHCWNNEAFPRAQVVVQRAELAYAVAPCPPHRAVYEVHADAVPTWSRDLHRMRPVDGAVELAPGVGLVPLPGHTPGSQGVRVDTVAGTYVITGDCVDTLDNWHGGEAGDPRPSGSYTDLPAFYDSLRLLAVSGWQPLPSHDWSVVRTAHFG